MTLYSLKIEDLFGYKETFIRINVLSLFSWVKNKLHIGSLKTGIINRIKNRFYKIYLISEGVKNIIPTIEENPEIAKEIYPHTQRALNNFRKLHNSLEKTNFFNDSRIRDLSESTLSNFYKLESAIRHSSFTNKNCNDEESLNRFASSISLGSLQAENAFSTTRHS